MPLHAWESVPSADYHHFHQCWAMMISIYLNNGRLPKHFEAYVERSQSRRIGDVLAIELFPDTGARSSSLSGVTTLERPKTSLIRESQPEVYSRRADRIVIKHKRKRVVAVIEIISPGNKDRAAAVRDFVTKVLEFVNHGVQLLVIDPLPPGKHDPAGMHKPIWDEIGQDEPFRFPRGRDRLAASYEISELKTAFVECMAVGVALPSIPLFLQPDYHVMIDLEETYQSAWQACPTSVRNALTIRTQSEKSRR